jgi:tetratricopeptide (TPR) repeat protein
MRDAADPTAAPSPRAEGRVLNAVAKTWPGFVSGAVEGRAHVLIAADRYVEAAAVLERGVERYGPESVSRLLLAWCLCRAERVAEALPWAEAAAKEEPQNAYTHWLLATLLFELGRTEEATVALWKAVELEPDNGRYHMQLAWHSHEDRAYADTRALMERALERAPEDAWVHSKAGRIYEYHLRHRLAQVHYERALELDPDEDGVRGDLAEILQARGRLGAGVRTAWEALREAGGEDAYTARLYEATLRRWSWRWYERALRAALLLNAVDWVVPAPVLGSGVLAGILVAVYAAVWVRSLAGLPPQCRRDLVGRGRAGFFAESAVRTALVLGGVVLVLVGELTWLQHLGVLGFTLAAYLEWYVRAVRISGKRAFGAEAAGAG